MEIQILGEISKNKYYKEIEKEYLERIKKYSNIKFVDKNISNTKDTYFIKICKKANTISSTSLAEKISDILSSGYSKLFIFKGEKNKNDEKEKITSDYDICLLDLNTTQDMENIFLLEQLYRVFKINNNETYHK